MNRRDFARLSALTLAASQLPAQSPSQKPPVSPTGAPTLAKPVGFAPVGLGTISNIFMRACAQTPNAYIAGLVTGHPETKGPHYASLYNVPASSIYTYETYDRIRDNPAIDAVYIGLPNSMHAEYTIRAAEAGKHVLCEKPMAISSAECRRMIDACRRANVKLMIGYRVHYDPTWIHIRDLARSGQIGEIEGFEGGFYGNMQPNQWRLDRRLAGGGSLMDLGIYPLNTLRWIGAEEPTGFRAFITNLATEKDPRFTGPYAVERTVKFLLNFPSGRLASAGSSYGMNAGPGSLTIGGSHGEITVLSAYSYSGLTFTARTTDGPLAGSSPGQGVYQFVYEADHFAACIRNNTQPFTPGEEGLADLLAIEAIYRAAGAPIA